jgi:stage IV sporulation protein B
MALPHGVAAQVVTEEILAKTKVIDLGADFRLKDADVYEAWYKVKHENRQMLKDAVYGLCEVNRDIIKGKNGHPGELKGSFGTEKKGSLLKNTPCGVFGVLSVPPEIVSEPLFCALKNEVAKGDAYILSNVDGRGVKKYSIKIDKIYSGNEETKNFVISVTDERLLALTGGIVRGMSGSPIIQDGKLVGAVTHVLVNDPTRGYGIFIENMLEAAK